MTTNVRFLGRHGYWIVPLIYSFYFAIPVAAIVARLRVPPDGNDTPTKAAGVRDDEL